jgi:hypothetical protein
LFKNISDYARDGGTKIPQKYSPFQSNAVAAYIVETMKVSPTDSVLLNRVDAIANELADRDAFDLVDGEWVLSLRQWEAWLQRGDDARYR